MEARRNQVATTTIVPCSYLNYHCTDVIRRDEHKCSGGKQDMARFTVEADVLTFVYLQNLLFYVHRLGTFLPV